MKRWVPGWQINFPTILSIKRKHTEYVISRKNCRVKIMVVFLIIISKQRHPKKL